MSKRYNQDINNTFYILQIFFYNTVVLRNKERNGQQCEKSINLRFFTRQICDAGITNLFLSQN